MVRHGVAHGPLGMSGRKGSGIPSLMLSMFRVFELDDAGSGGRITINWVNTYTAGLGTLYESISIIPQGPVPVCAESKVGGVQGRYMKRADEGHTGPFRVDMEREGAQDFNFGEGQQSVPRPKVVCYIAQGLLQRKENSGARRNQLVH